VRYRISHLEKGANVEFRFVADGGNWNVWERPGSVHPFNEDGDVSFERQGLSVAREDQEHIRPFVLLALILIILFPLVLAPINTPAEVAALIAWLSVSILLARHVRPVSRVIERIISRTLITGSPNPTFEADAGGEGRIYQAGQSMYITFNNEDDQ
jgi:hypothetical protein